MMIDSEKKQKFAIVTGAAKRVGKEIALHLAQKGYAIGLHYWRSIEEAQKTAEEICKMNSSVVLLKADLSDPKQITELFEKNDFSKYSLNVLVNSASIMPRSDLLILDVLDWDRIQNINLRAVWLMSQQAAKYMVNGSVIINISDTGSEQNWSNYGAYVISKAGVNTLTSVMARQLAPKIRVCGIAPGLLLKAEEMTNAEWERLINKVPLQKEADMHSLYTTIDLMLENGYITGEIIHLDGGAHLL